MRRPVGIRKTTAGFEVLSTCNDLGIVAFEAGPYSGETSDDGYTPIMTSVELRVALADADVTTAGQDAPRSVSARNPVDAYVVTGSLSGLDLDAPFVITVEGGRGGGPIESSVVDLGQMDVGDIALPDYSTSPLAQGTLVSPAEFADMQEDCIFNSPSPAKLILWLMAIVLAAILVLVLAGFAVWKFVQLARAEDGSGSRRSHRLVPD